MRRRHVAWVAAAFALVAALVVARSVLYYPPFISLPGIILACACLGWAALVRLRVVNARLRRLLVLTAGSLVSLIVLQHARYEFTAEGTLATRLLWYAYYLPLTAVPLLSFFTACSVGAGEDVRPLARWLWLVVPAALLSGLFLTNDLHELAFTFPPGGPRLVSEASHGPLYYVEVAWIAVLLTLALAIAVVRCGRIAARRAGALALAPLAAGGAYLLSYVFNGSAPLAFGSVRFLQFQDVFCLMVLAFWEVLIQAGVIPSNSDYAPIFQAASFAAFIADDEGQVRYRTVAPMQANARQRAAAADGPVATGPHTLLHAMAIPGGAVYWESNLAQVHAARTALAEAHESLRERNELLSQQNALAEERARLDARARLYERTAAALESELAELEAHLEEARTAEGAVERDALARALYVGTHVKRASNLAIIAEQQGSVPAEELVLALSETLAAAEGLGLYGQAVLLADAALPAGRARAAYDAVYLLGAALAEGVADRRTGAALAEGVADAWPVSAAGETPGRTDLAVAVDGLGGPAVHLTCNNLQLLAAAEAARAELAELGCTLAVHAEDGTAFATLSWTGVRA